MKLRGLLKALIKQNKTGNGYQIHLNSDNLDNKSSKNLGIEIGDLYFTECSTLKDAMILCFGNMGRKPTDKSKDGTDLYPVEVNTNMFIDINKIESIEDVKDFRDWFYLPSSKVINVYMFPEDDDLNGNRNIITIVFLFLLFILLFCS